MPIDTRHPDYKKREDEWRRIRDALEGERAIKAGGIEYLPAPPGMPVGMGDFLDSGKRTSNSRYVHYQTFAEFPEIVEPALNGFQGIIHSKEPRILLPDKMKYLEKDATVDGDTLLELWRAITREILSGGRIGLLCDVNDDDDLLRFATYSVENITNWRIGPKREGGKAQFIVLREMRELPKQEDEFCMEEVVFWRELRLVNTPNGTVYTSRLLSKRNGKVFEEEPWTLVSHFANTFDEIPFVAVNALDTGFKYGAVPLKPLVDRAVRIYRLTADYYRSLYIKSDPQVVLSGVMEEDVPTEIGGAKIWNFPNTEATASYLDIDGKGIPLQREAINDQYHRFWEEGARLLAPGDAAPESGRALQRREHSKQVTLKSVVINAGNALEKQLRKVAVVLGIDPELVQFKPDLDFASPSMTGQEAFEWAQAQNAGFPISDFELHALAVRGGATELTFEETTAKQFEEGPKASLPPPRVSNLDNRNAVPPEEDEHGDGE